MVNRLFGQFVMEATGGTSELRDEGNGEGCHLNGDMLIGKGTIASWNGRKIAAGKGNGGWKG